MPTSQAPDGSAMRLLANDVRRMPLTAHSEPARWVDGGWPVSSAKLLAQHLGANVVVWEMTAGVVTDVEADEILIVLSGEGEVRFQDGERVTLVPGVAIRLVGGEHVEWTVPSSIRAVTVTPTHLL